MKRILLGFDGSEYARQAINELINAGLPSQAEARVLTVADVWLSPEPAPPSPPVPGASPEAWQKSRDNALQALNQAREVAEEGAALLRAKFPGWMVQSSSKADSPGWAVLQEANHWPADLVIVGAHSHGTLHRFFLGSVSQKVVSEARCSVRIARPHHLADGRLRIVLAVDGSTDSSNAVDEVSRRTWPAGAEFHLVTVVDPKLQSYAALPALFPADWLHPGDQAEEWVVRMTNQFAQKLRQRGLNVAVHVFDGDPRKRLLDHADSWKADCIFLGARGLNHGDRLYLGTFASAIASRAHCSVEIVRQT